MGSRAYLIFGLVAGLGLLSGCASTAPAEPVQDRVGNLVLRNVPEVPQALQDRLRQYGNTRSARVHGFLGDDLIIGTRFSEVTQLHRVSEPLGLRQQLTYGAEPIISAAPSPDGQNIAFLRDSGGAEFYQVFLMDVESGRTQMLSDGKSRYGGLLWNRDGTALAMSVSSTDGLRHAVEVVRPDGTVQVAIERAGGSYAGVDFNADGTELLVREYRSINLGALHRVDLATGDVETLIGLERDAAIGWALYAPDEQSILLTTDLGSEFMSLLSLSADGELDALTPDVPWDVEGFAVLRGAVVLSVNEGGYSRLRGMSWPDRGLIALPELPAGVLRGMEVAPDRERLALSVNAAAHPTDAFVLDMSDRALVRWTRSEIGGLDPEQFLSPELIEVESFDGLTVPGLVYRPATPGPHPVVISIHGGPEGQSRPWFSPTLQFLLNELNVAVVVPNVRGSRGYGKSFLKLDNGRLREDSVKDIGAMLDWIADEPALDSSRVSVMGGSYGGYMVLAAMIRYSDRLIAGIERVGISNFVTFLENTQPYRQDLRRVEYGDERDPEMRAFLESISPLNQAERIVDPLLIVQGFNDPRVPYTESEQIYDALQASNVPVWFLMAMDEGHGFRKKRNRDVQSAVTMRFLQEHLLGNTGQ